MKFFNILIAFAILFFIACSDNSGEEHGHEHGTDEHGHTHEEGTEPHSHDGDEHHEQEEFTIEGDSATVIDEADSHDHEHDHDHDHEHNGESHTH